MNRRPKTLMIASSAVFVIAILLAGYELFGVKELTNPKTTDVSAQDEEVDELSDDADESFWNLEADQESTDSKNTTSNKKAIFATDKLPSSALIPTNPVSQNTTQASNSTAPIVPPQNDNEVDEEEPDEPELQRYMIDDFENGSLANWTGEITLASPGYESPNAIKLSNVAGESTAGKRIFETPILKGFTNLEFYINSEGKNFLENDASAIAFEQGAWKWVSLADYAQSDAQGWQHIIIPLSDFAGLDQNSAVANLTFRFWNEEACNYLIDNISLTGQVSAMPAPTDLAGNTVSANQIDLSWSGAYSQYNVYKDNFWIASVQTPEYSVTDLDPNTTYKFFVTGVDNTIESIPSDSIFVKTSPFVTLGFVLSDFEGGDFDGWTGENIAMTEGLSSLYALRLTGLPYDAAGMEKVFNLAIAKGHENLEFDINLNGKYYDSENMEVDFEQADWQPLSLGEYIENGKDGWQHIIVPLSDFLTLNSDEAITRIVFRFWNTDASHIDIDNITLN